MTFDRAMRLFRDKRVVQRARFDRLSAKAKQRAFTVAGVIANDALAVIQDEMAQLIGSGTSLAEFGKVIDRRMQDAGFLASLRPLADGRQALRATHLETVFRTNVLGAYNAGRAEHAAQPLVLAKRPVWEIRSVQDGRTRETHKVVNGVKLLARDPFWRTAYPPFGYNCFLPGTIVEGRFIGASKALYAGQVVELTSAVGRRLTVTANHPVLTARGVLRAQDVREGDELVGYSGQVGIAPLSGRAQRNEHDRPASVEQVFDALSESRVARTSDYRAADFHGEARMFHGEIKVAGSYILSLVLGSDCPPERDPHARPFKVFRAGSAAVLDPVLTDDSAEGGARYADFLGELLHAGAGAVSRDRVTLVRKLDWAGHVYDLQTETGWLVADGVFASNCRCRVITRGPEHLPDVVPGSTVEGLPDEGFTSGIGSLLSPVD